MKIIKIGSILDASHGIIVHGCNAQGVMNSGLAKAIREKFPTVYEEYHREYLANGLKTGQLILVEVGEELLVANAITQEFFGRGPRYVSYEAIQKVFSTLAKLASDGDLVIHYPMIGAGLGGGDWSVISEIIDNAFAQYPKAKRILWLED